jgi:hypothetical protein
VKEQDPATAGIVAGLRIDLVIAVCALLISTLATAASWWQTRVIQQELNAQVWPYVSVSESLTDSDTVQISVENDGLGPAVLQSAVISVDGKPLGSFIDVMHALLGPHLIARAGGRRAMTIALADAAPGVVLRPGDATTAFRLTSARFARPFMLGHHRLAIRTCYCAIVPGECWLADSGAPGPPARVPACAIVPNDLLHGGVDQLLRGDV